LISAPELSKHLTTSQCPCIDVKCLLSSGVDINLPDQLGRSPLLEVSFAGQCDVIKCLLSSIADINLCDDNGQSPLFTHALMLQTMVIVHYHHVN
jgi:ankyrin repeat protein